MNYSKGRRKWDDVGDKIPMNAPASKEEVPPQYEHYLHLLQERNRLIKNLRHKNRKDIELEKKEKGFTLYLNSSFSGEKESRPKSDRKHRPQRVKTAGEADNTGRPNHLPVTSKSQRGISPSQARERRRNWKIGSVELKAADGQRQKVKPPDNLSGKYTEDFEDDNSSDEDRSEIIHSLSSLDENGLDDDDSPLSPSDSTSSLNSARRHKTSYLKRVAAAKKEEIESENRIVITMDEVKTLRESLQMNKFIRQSLAMCDESDVEESLDLSSNEDNSDGERVSPIDEEEIEEMISSDEGVGGKGDNIKPLPYFKPGDTLVLEFQPPASKKKAGQVLNAARKKSSDSHTSISPILPSRLSSKKSSPNPSHFTSSHRSTSAPKGPVKAIRPVSASRKSSDAKTDSEAEASAVLKALQEENKKAEIFSKVSNRPLPQPKSLSNPAKSSSSSRDKPSAAPSPVRSQADPQVSRSSSGVTGSMGSQGSMVKASGGGDGDEHKDGSHVVQVVDKVMKMNPQQQKQLLQVLNHIDTDQSDASKQSLAPVASSWSSKAPVTDRLEVTMEILSNWGHPSLVGLTELQFFGPTGCLVPIQPSDVTVHGARGVNNSVDVLFNGKSKTTKERNMWSCKFDGRPVEFSILIINPTPGKAFSLGAIKVWNWNNKISNLDIGVRQVRIFFGGELLFSGEVDKGCGNQVFDYSKHIVLSTPDSHQHSSTGVKSKKGPHSSNSATHNKSQSTSKHSTKGSSSSPQSKKTISPPMRGGDGGNSASNSGSHHTFQNISRSPQSSASSSGSHHSLSRVRTASEERTSLEDKRERSGSKERSETRTLMRPTILKRRGSGGGSSGFSSPEVETKPGDLSSIPDKMRAQTPMKSKRVAARLNGKSSETETSGKSNTDSYESKPPLPRGAANSNDKSVNRSSSTSRHSSDKSSAAIRNTTTTGTPVTPKSSKSEPHISPRTNSVSPHRSVKDSQSHKIKGDNSQSHKTKGKREEESLVDKMKSLSTKESKRKKEFPKWLNKDANGDNSAESSKSGKPGGEKVKDENDIQKQLDMEFEEFSTAGSDNKTEEREAEDQVSPMKKIEKTRAKWRKKEEDLEETWGNLSFFNKSQRGRLSIDMQDDVMDQYLSSSPTKKSTTDKQEKNEVPKLPIADEPWSDEEDEFTIPELPYGRELVINIKSTWGDHHYVGLTGIQLFSSTGEAVSIAKIWANPSDINELPEYKCDPRVVTNVIDNVNRTRDDVHMWLAPFTSGNNHYVYLTFAKPCKLALMRVWNYNKSRIHSFRGAKDVVIALDGSVVFKGEIARACGGIEGGTEAFGDTILFTMDEGILEAVSKNDDAFEGEMPEEDLDDNVEFERPSTADAEDDTRPFTRAAGKMSSQDKGGSMTPPPTTSFITYAGDMLVYKANKLQLLFTATWGDHHYLGLTGLEVVGRDGEAVAVSMDNLLASPCDLRHLPGNEKDDRTLDKLIDGTNVTCQDSHMWLIPFTEGDNHSVTISFPQQTLVSGIRLWNYNKSPEDTYRGAKVVHVQINDRTVSPPEGYLLRKGPGVCHFDFAQEVIFSTNQNQSSNSSSGSDGPQLSVSPSNDNNIQMPRGFIFQIQLFSTWGDQYYVGLNGLEFYDASFKKIDMTQNNISAYPDSVNVLENVSNDARTPDKLIDGMNDTNDGRHMWLAPILPNIVNRVYVIFDQPTSVSMIRLWNYSKTLNRGVKDFALLVDDLLVYNGTLQSVSGGAKGIVPNCDTTIPHHTILFSDNKEMARRERNAIISNQVEDQDIQLLNDKQVVSKFAKASSSKPVNQALRPKTSVTKTARR